MLGAPARWRAAYAARPGPARLIRGACAGPPSGPSPGRLPPQHAGVERPCRPARSPAPFCPQGERREPGPGPARGEGAAGLALTRRTPALKSRRISEGKSFLVVGAFRAWGRFCVFLAVRKSPAAGRCPRVLPVVPAERLPRAVPQPPPAPCDRAPLRASSVSACPADDPPRPLSSQRCYLQIHTLWRAERVF